MVVVQVCPLVYPCVTYYQRLNRVSQMLIKFSIRDLYKNKRLSNEHGLRTYHLGGNHAFTRGRKFNSAPFFYIFFSRDLNNIRYIRCP